MRFKKGQPRPKNAGRKKGTPNKLTATIKEEIEKVYLGLGGWESMLDWARANPDGFYGTLLPKIIPKDLNLKTSGVVRLKVNLIVDAPARKPGLGTGGDGPAVADPA